MNKLDFSPSALRLSTDSFPRLQAAHRLIVLVPSLEGDLTAVTSRIWELANATGASVQFLGLYSDPDQEPGVRRELVTMSAMVKDARVSVESEVIFGKNWADVLKTRFRTGDIIVCFAEQYVGLSHRPLSEVLQSNLSMPLYILSGLYPQKDSSSKWPAQLAVWVGSITIIAGFFLLQIKVDHLAKDWTHTLLLLLSIPVELGLILAWNSLLE